MTYSPLSLEEEDKKAHIASILGTYLHYVMGKGICKCDANSSSQISFSVIHTSISHLKDFYYVMSVGHILVVGPFIAKDFCKGNDSLVDEAMRLCPNVGMSLCVMIWGQCNI